MKKLISFIQKIWAWCVKTFTSKHFAMAFPFAAFLVIAFFSQSFISLLCAVIWLFPIILGINETTE
jgi:uncharacterized membrane protein YpjA